MKIVCIVQARIGSKRLPAKVLLPLPNRLSVLEQVLEKCRKIRGVDEFVCAIPNTDENLLLLPFIERSGWRTMVGPEHDVLERYRLAAKQSSADVVLRVTADCPLIAPDVCEDLLRMIRKLDVGYVSNAWPARSYPHGHDCEAFTSDTLRRAAKSAVSAHDREHVCPWMQRDPGTKRAFLKSMQDRSGERLTLDTLEDYVRIWNVMQNEIDAGI